MSSPTGAHGEADATKQENEQQPQSTASTDATLNARAKSSNGAKSQGPKKWLIALIAIIAAVAVIVAIAVTCGKNDDANTSGVTKADTVTIGLKLAPVSLDIRHQSGSAIEQVLIGNVYEALLSRDSDNKVQPGLAKSWDISKDGKTYAFHLNQNMTFSNGDKLDADDVAWSINQLKEKQYYNANQVASLDKAEAVDANTVKLTLSTPDSNLLWYLTGRPGLVFDKNAKYNAKTEAVGSGPYTVESFDSASKMVLKANAKYWGTAHKPATQNVVIRFLTDDNAAVNALKSGDVDVLSPVNATLAKSLDASTYTVSAADGSDKFVLAFNCTNDKLKDKRVRQAIRYGINHKEIIASRGNVDYALGGPIPSVDPGYEDLTGLYPYNVDKAKKLKKEAGLYHRQAVAAHPHLRQHVRHRTGRPAQEPARQNRHRFEDRLCGILHMAAERARQRRLRAVIGGPRRKPRLLQVDHAGLLLPLRQQERAGAVRQGARRHRREGKRRIPQAGGENRQRRRTGRLAVRLPCDRGVQQGHQGIPRQAQPDGTAAMADFQGGMI